MITMRVQITNDDVSIMVTIRYILMQCALLNYSPSTIRREIDIAALLYRPVHDKR